jgi:hypothetical protein
MNGKSTLEVPLELVEEKGYLARCVSIDAVAWGQTLAEAGDALVDAVIETAETLVEDCPTPQQRTAETVILCASRLLATRVLQ